MVAPAAVLTLEHIKRDLARKPPPPPASASTSESHASLRGLALCLLLHQQLQLHAMTCDDNDSTQQQQVARDLKRTEAALWQAAADVVEEEEGAHADAPHDFEMAEAWGEEGEEGEEDAAQEAASTKEWYLKLLTKYNVLPVRLSLPTSSESSSSSSSSSDESEHQSMRDIERDSLKVNGAAYQPGGLGGHTRVLAWLEDVLHSHLQASGCSPLPPKAVLDLFVRRLLRQVNRTNSAGAAYDVLSKRLGVEGVTAIVPDSKAAEPLEIEVDTGVFPLPSATAAVATAAAAGGKGGGFGWGLRARLRTATSYVIYDEGVEEEWTSLRAEYRETVCLTLVLVGGGEREGGRGRGVVRQQPVSLGASVRLSEREKGT